MDDRCFEDRSCGTYSYGIGQPLYEYSGISIRNVNGFSYRIGRLHLYLEQCGHRKPHHGNTFDNDELYGHGDGPV